MLIDASKYPLLSQRLETPFVQDLTEHSMNNVEGALVRRGVWNMIISQRDLSLWCKHKMKPSAWWKVTDVKKYFGLTGSGEKLLAQFEALTEEVERLLGGKGSLR